jgi:adenosine deaminase CECR1
VDDIAQESTDQDLPREGKFTLRRSPRKNSKVAKLSNVQPITMGSSMEKEASPASMETNSSQDPAAQAQNQLIAAIKQIGDNSQYERKRSQLLLEEEKGSWDASAGKRASPVQREAAEIVRKVREKERVDPKLFGNLPGEAVPVETTHDLGGRFVKNHESIAHSKLFNIAHKMPKGAHLHLHFNSELPPEDLFPIATKNVPRNMFIRSTCPLIDRLSFEDCEIVFNVLPEDTKPGDLFSADYSPDWKSPDNRAWMLWADFKQRFPIDDNIIVRPNKIGERQFPNKPLERPELWALDKMVITEHLKYTKAQTHNSMWACFNQGTRAFKGLVNYESVYRWYVGAAIDSMVLHKIMYAELRPMLMDKTIPKDDGRGSLDHKDQMQIILDVVKAKQQMFTDEGRPDAFPFGVRIIYCTPRSIPKAKMQSELEDCIKLALQFKEQNLVCGKWHSDSGSRRVC